MKKVRFAVICTAASILLLAGCGMDSGAREARHLAVGQRHMEKHDYARAALEFRNAVKAAPNSADAHYQLGLALLASGDAVGGVQSLTRCTELNPKHAGAQSKLSELMITSTDPEVLAEARKRAKAAFEASPGDVAALDAMAAATWSREKTEDSEQFLERALERAPGHLKSAVMLARIKLAIKDYPAAEEVLRRTVEANPQLPEARQVLGALYRVLKRDNDAEAEFQAALKANPQFGPALLELARLRVAQGRKDEAGEVYKRVAALPNPEYRPAYALFLLYLVDAQKGTAELDRLFQENPKSRDLRTRLVSAYFLQKRWQEAEKVLTVAISKNASDVPALLQHAELLIATGRYNDAEKATLKAQQADATLSTPHMLLASIFAARNEPLRQRQELGEALRLDPTSLSIRLALANEHLRAKSVKAALDVLNQAPEYQRGSVEYRKTRIWALLDSGALDEAGKLLQMATAGSEDPEFVLQSANLRLRLKDVAGARKLLESLLKANPGNGRALQGLMQTYASTGQTSAGIQQIKMYAARQKSSAAVQMLLATWLRKAGDLAGSYAAAESAAAAEPSSLAPRLMCAELALLQKKFEAARGSLNALPESQRSTPEAQMLYALIEQEGGNYEKSMEHLRTVLAASPKSVPALNNLAYLLVDYAGKPDEGLKYAQQVMELAPEDNRVEDTIGWAFYAKGLYPTAVGHLERAVARDSNAAVPRYHLAMAYLRLGQREKAHQELAAATRLDPKAPERKRASDLISGSTR